MKTRPVRISRVSLGRLRLGSSIVILLLIGAASAGAQCVHWFSGYVAPQRYIIITERAPVYNVESYSRHADYDSDTDYLYDYVNRASSLTPEPIWRSMFASIRQRTAAERRAFSVPGETAREIIYYRRQAAAARDQ